MINYIVLVVVEGLVYFNELERGQSQMKSDIFDKRVTIFQITRVYKP